MTLPWTPVILTDGLGSLMALALAISCLVISHRWYQQRLWDLFRHYLFFFTLALVVFAVSRSGGHLVKQLLILSDNRHIWQMIAPFTGAINTATFVVIFAVSMYSRRIGLAHREILSYQNDLKALVEKRTRLLEEQLQFQEELLNAIPIPVYFTDAEGRISGCNDALTLMFGCDKESLTGKMPEEIPELRSCLPFLDLCPEAGCNTKALIKKEKSLLCANGKKRDLILYGNPFCDRNGTMKGSIGAIIDISERKMLEAQILQTEKLETVATMAGGIAHEFNNILAAIMGFAELAQHKIDPGIEIAHDLEQILSSSRRARDLIKQILVFSRQKSLNCEPCDLVEIIKNAVSLLRHRLKTGMEIETSMCEKKAMVMADQGQLQQVFLNLGHNGINAMAEKGGILQISCKEIKLPDASQPAAASLAPGEYIRVRVSDQGVGMEPAVMQRIFDPFFSTREVGDGSGLGLSVVHGVIKNHGGMVRVESSPGHGTTFEILLPKIHEEKKPEKEKVGPAPIVKAGGKVLLVDDEESVAEMLATMIKRLGFEVQTYNDPIRALEGFKENPDQFGLALFDEIMPAMSGTELARLVRDIRPKLPVIICSGYSNEMEGKPAHINVWLTKPVSLKDLGETLKQFLASGG